MQIDFKILDLTLHLIRLGMGIDKDFLCADTDFSVVMPDIYKLAKHHDVAHIVAYAVKKLGIKCDEETAKKLDKQYLISIYRYQHQRYDLSVILNAFEAGKIMHIPLKGSVLRSFYPQEWMRTGCDIDILVKEDDLDVAKDTLVNIGYKAGFKMTHDISLESPGGTHVELHFDLIEKDKHGTEITGTNSMVEKAFLDSVKAGDEKEITFTQNLDLQGGEYLISLGVTGYEGDKFQVYHRLYDVLNLTVVSDKNTVGYYDMNSKVVVK